MFVFFDRHQSQIDIYYEILSHVPNTYFVVGDVRDLVQTYRIDVLVSPANAAGYMDGGIDAVYCEMFPEIQDRVKRAIANQPIRSPLGRPLLPVGQALLVETGDELVPHLAVVPTMTLPGPITHTKNVYHAFSALLKLPLENKVVAIPCLGTGVGEMSACESATQILAALNTCPIFKHGLVD